MNITLLRRTSLFRPATWILFLVALGMGCSHARTPHGATQSTIGAGGTALPAEEPRRGTGTPTGSVASAAGGVVPAVDPEAIHPMAAVPSATAPALRIPRRFSWVSHKVRDGETLTAIARRYRVSVQMRRGANKLNQSDEPAVGRIILFPAKAFSPPA